jgi:microcompartment protein CcmL/EutN
MAEENNTQAWHLFLNVSLGNVEEVKACVTNGVIERCPLKDIILALAIANPQPDILKILFEHPELSNMPRLQRDIVTFLSISSAFVDSAQGVHSSFLQILNLKIV